MAVDDTVLGALKRAVRALGDELPWPIPTELLIPLVEVARPGLYIHFDVEASCSIGAPLITLRDEPDAIDLLATLTNRQREVADLIIKGLPNRVIALQLGISLATIKDHVHAILGRLELPSRTALIAASLR